MNLFWTTRPRVVILDARDNAKLFRVRNYRMINSPMLDAIMAEFDCSENAAENIVRAL